MHLLKTMKLNMCDESRKRFAIDHDKDEFVVCRLAREQEKFMNFKWNYAEYTKIVFLFFLIKHNSRLNEQNRTGIYVE